MIYAKYTPGDEINHESDHSGHYRIYHEKGIKSIELFDPTEDESPTFYYDRHDLALRNIEFMNFLGFNEWKVFKTNINSRIIINFTDDYLNILDLKRIGRVIKIKALDASRITLAVMDPLFKQFIEKEFTKVGIKGMNVVVYPHLLKTTIAPQNLDNSTSYKFSALSRNYSATRLELYLRLLEDNSLPDFQFSFHNLKPYHFQGPISIEKMKLDAVERFGSKTPRMEGFIEEVPYDLGQPEYKWSDVTFDAIYNSDFHLLVESHFDCYLDGIWSYAKEEHNEEEFAPAFATEKTYKVINCKRPFIAFSTPYFLKGMNEMGLKTFSPYIDESYDTILDNTERMKAIVAEVKRIRTLPQDEYETLISNIKPITEHNFNFFVEMHQDTSLLENDKDLRQILPFQPQTMVTKRLNPKIY